MYTGCELMGGIEPLAKFSVPLAFYIFRPPTGLMKPSWSRFLATSQQKCLSLSLLPFTLVNQDKDKTLHFLLENSSKNIFFPQTLPLVGVQPRPGLSTPCSFLTISHSVGTYMSQWHSAIESWTIKNSGRVCRPMCLLLLSEFHGDLCWILFAGENISDRFKLRVHSHLLRRDGH